MENMTSTTITKQESPEYLRMSLAAAMTLGFKPGLFHRNAELGCINLLLTYENGCAARCAYCGLSGERKGAYREKSFIRVAWPTYSLTEIIERISQRPDRIKRVCISMVTNRRAVEDTRFICEKLRNSFDVPVSLLISPTILTSADLRRFKDAGADKIGVAVDLAAPELFERYRGRSVNGPHRWETYWNCFRECIDIFGKGMAGTHLMVGMGETERQMCDAIRRTRDAGGYTHLFSYHPEAGCGIDGLKPPGMDHYRRVQLARYIIDEGLAGAGDFSYDEAGRITGFGLQARELDALIDNGDAFRTSGCTGYDGEVACNRPYGNSRPGPDVRNYPFKPDASDIVRIREQMGLNPAAKEGE